MRHNLAWPVLSGKLSPQEELAKQESTKYAMWRPRLRDGSQREATAGAAEQPEVSNMIRSRSVSPGRPVLIAGLLLLAVCSGALARTAPGPTRGRAPICCIIPTARSRRAN